MISTNTAKPRRPYAPARGEQDSPPRQPATLPANYAAPPDHAERHHSLRFPHYTPQAGRGWVVGWNEQPQLRWRGRAGGQGLAGEPTRRPAGIGAAIRRLGEK